MNFNSYLERIGMEPTEELKPDESTLFKLQRAHLLHVPFEDIDIQTGVSILLNPELFYDKVVSRCRGGYCYELNGLFGELLRHIGFEVHLLSGRVCNGAKVGAPFDHLALLVKTGNADWLVDVGFGDFSLQPLQMNGEVQYDGDKHYRIGRREVAGAEYLTADKWQPAKKQFVPEYIFTLQPYELSDFEEMNYYQQTSPESHFVQNFICSLPLENGRVSIINRRLIITGQGQRRETAIRDQEHCAALLQEYFNIQEEGILPGRNF